MKKEKNTIVMISKVPYCIVLNILSMV